MTIDRQASLTQLGQAVFDPTSQADKVLLVDASGVPYVAGTAALDFGANAAAGRVAAQIGNSSGANSASNPVFTGLVVSGAVYDARLIRALTSADVVSAAQSGAWSVSVSNFPATQPVSGTVAATQSGIWTVARSWTLASGTDSVAAVQNGTWNITNISGTISLPTGASTSALQTTGNTSLASIDTKTLTAGQKTSANSYPVVLASDQATLPISNKGLTYLSKARIDYTGTPVTTAAYVTLISTVGATAVQYVDIFDSSGQTLVIATGAAASEVDQFYITPGGVTYSVAIPANTRLSIKAVSATANTGSIAINIFG